MGGAPPAPSARAWTGVGRVAVAHVEHRPIVPAPRATSGRCPPANASAGPRPRGGTPPAPYGADLRPAAAASSQAPVAAAAVTAFPSRFLSSSLPALVLPPPPLPEGNPFAALLSSDPPPPQPLRLVLATGDVRSAFRGLPGLARQLSSSGGGGHPASLPAHRPRTDKGDRDR
ncbi:U1 small nuclear ribonucleoprotein C-like [Panicum virgatum]|uniref:U1 small nuclear ribonucleoprotein C-like n=1 Tax=Panicum virgatum TaxID=38727 RepID=UPI0019D5E155|nr:U1 small nuclear ribonucleoprotein C-like [Panicum virgatum]